MQQRVFHLVVVGPQSSQELRSRIEYLSSHNIAFNRIRNAVELNFFLVFLFYSIKMKFWTRLNITL